MITKLFTVARKKPVRIGVAAAVLLVVILAGCASQHRGPATRALTSAEKKVAAQVESRGQVCLRQFEVMHPAVSLRNGVGPCMAALAPARQRRAFEARLLASAQVDKPWRGKASRDRWYNDLAVWVVRHGGSR